MSEGEEPSCEEEEERRRPEGEGEEDAKSELLKSDVRALPAVGEAETSSIVADVWFRTNLSLSVINERIVDRWKR